MRRMVEILGLAMAATTVAASQQITVSRIEQMPNLPAPYQMRDWKRVARGYDSLVFDLSRTGTYLPLIRVYSNTINYPGHNSFGLHTVVGTTAPLSAEAINCLPAVIGATLAGIDKRNQAGYDWVLMAEEWFNRRPSQNVYKNHPVDDSGDDWWYATMPNVFFYQLNDLYPGTGDFNYQFSTVADRWLQAARAMGGSTMPWRVPNMNHRGWYLNTMTPYDAGVHEPEAAGALAWIFYNAHLRTDSSAYRIGAEWAMEFLDSYGANPSYELQLPYGVLTAARMNAELGTMYNVERMLNWCFDVGPLRSWGAIVGQWGGNDCSGLIGEVNGSNDYAFVMNTFEQIGALVPLVRYDDRFARAVGKWVLNAANAARLFYPAYLPADHQDNAAWAAQYDSASVIAYEALRQQLNAQTPYGTGDAITGGWGATTLTLYGSSHVGILAGIIDTTDVSMILALDLLKTDYYRKSAYPSFLYFNPYAVRETVHVDLGPGLHDVYDAVSNSIVRTNVSGATALDIPADGAIIAVITPAGGSVTYDLDRMLVNGVVVDYRSGLSVANYPPRIKSLAAESHTIVLGGSVTLYSTATDRDSDTLSYSWNASGGTILGEGTSVLWVAPLVEGTYLLRCRVDDGHGGSDSAQTAINVVSRINALPVISRITALPRKVNIGAASDVRCTARDPDGDTLTYNWSASGGALLNVDSVAQWTAPLQPGNYVVRCRVFDGYGGSAIDSVSLMVRDFSQSITGTLVAHYPFDGNANDVTGHGYDGVTHGAVLAPDRAGAPGKAYAFDGLTSYIGVANSPGLNMQKAITINFWMKVGAFYSREQYPVSHGNWENRWKVSISNGRLRWTVKTGSGVKDLDSESSLVLDSTYMVTVTYNGADLELWLNGALDAFTSFGGTILQTTYDLTIGQVLPNNQGYNFNGVLDDLRLYDYALSVPEIAGLFAGTTGAVAETGGVLPREYFLHQNFPNPFNPSTTISFEIPASNGGEQISLSVFDLLGRKIGTLVEGRLSPGVYSIRWQPHNAASGVYFCVFQSSQMLLTRTMLLMR
ncbi:MAG: LamG-like jellyroll fold domain-containing protein [Bacteroidota bacterium]